MHVWTTFKRLFLCIFLVISLSNQVDARGGSSFSSGSRSFSSGSSSRGFSSGSSSRSFSSGSSSKSFSSGSSKSTTPASSPKSSSIDSKASVAVKHQESKTSFFTSRATYTRPPVSEPKVQEAKQQVFYKTYYTNPAYTREIHHYHYRDSYNPYFMLWMMDRSIDERALWAYNHRSDMDQERYKEMLAKDAALESRIKELETKGVPKDPNYKPRGIDNDLIYKSDKEMREDNSGDSVVALKAIVVATAVILVVGIGIWAVFFKKWEIT